MNTTSSLQIDTHGTLSPREEEAFAWLAFGKRVEEIGVIMGITARGARAHVDAAQQKLGASTKYRAISLAFMHGYLKWACMLMLALGTALPHGDEPLRPNVRTNTRLTRTAARRSRQPDLKLA